MGVVLQFDRRSPEDAAAMPVDLPPLEFDAPQLRRHRFAMPAAALRWLGFGASAVALVPVVFAARLARLPLAVAFGVGLLLAPGNTTTWLLAAATAVAFGAPMLLVAAVRSLRPR